ncbi:surface antigen protein [Angomonas deanei]|nr:surface antigen protein [Angomonas deanei]|eukprot:EPY17551.1 surface antigen protein [Angomonas deanei]
MLLNRASYGLTKLACKYFVVLCLILFSLNVKAGSDYTTASFLTDIRAHFNVPRSTHPNWYSTSDFCEWEGVTCESATSVAVNLSSSGLSSSTMFEPKSGKAVYVTSLDLSNNPGLRGEWEDDWDELVNLQYLDLSYTGFHGEFPDDWKDMKSLQVLKLRGTTFTEKLDEASDWKDMSLLRILDLTDAEFRAGTVPSKWFSFGVLPNLQALYLGGTSATNVLRSFSSYSLPSLEILDISRPKNPVCEELPTSFSTWAHSRLQSLRMTGQLISKCAPDGYLTNPVLYQAIYETDLTVLDQQTCSKRVNCNKYSDSTKDYLDALKDSFPKLQSVWAGDNHCQWRGVSCRPNGGVQVDVSSFDLAGTLPVSFSSTGPVLLTSVSFSNNPNLIGFLPDSLDTQLPFLQSINLDYTGLFGPIPSWTKFRFLETFSVVGARLCQGLPFWTASDFPILRTVLLSSNNLKGPLAAGWSGLELERLDLEGNHFCGCIPSSWDSQVLKDALSTYSELSQPTCNIENACGNEAEQCSTLNIKATQSTLLFLRLLMSALSIPNWNGDDYCSFPGVTCTEIDGVEGVNISLKGRYLAGKLPEIPDTIRGSQVLVWSIDLSDNRQIEGLFPVSWSRLSQLRRLSLGNTLLYGTLPSQWGAMRNLTELDVSNTMACRSLPDWGGNSIMPLKKLVISDTNIMGSLPLSFESLLVGGLTIEASRISFCGCTPKMWIAQFPTVNGEAFKKANLNSCATSNVCKSSNFKCSLPQQGPSSPDANVHFLVSLREALGNEKRLAEWQYTDGGNYCAWFGIRCLGTENGFSVDLSGQDIQGTLPDLSGIEGLPALSLVSLDLSNNPRLKGTLPLSWGNLASIERINLSHTSVGGRIPAVWGDMKALRELSLSSTNVCGLIPSWTASRLVSIERLDLSNNRLQGNLPESWSSFDNLNLAAVDVSGNDDLCQCLPSGWLSIVPLYEASLMAFGTVDTCSTSQCPRVDLSTCPDSGEGTPRPSTSPGDAASVTQVGNTVALLLVQVLIISLL